MSKVNFKLKKILPAAGCFLIGALSSSCTVIGASAPFAAIFAASLPTAYGAFLAIGCTAAMIFRFSPGLLISSLTAVAAVIVKKRLLSSHTQPVKQFPFIAAALTTAAYLIFLAAICAIFGASSLRILGQILCAPLLLFGMLTLLRSVSQIKAGAGIELLSAAVLIAFVSICLAPFQISFFSLGGVAASLIVLSTALRFGGAYAAAAAAICALGAAICSPKLFTDMALFCLPALFCGSFCYDSPVRAALILISSYSASAVVFGGDRAAPMAASSAIASAVFVVFSQKFFSAARFVLPSGRPTSKSAEEGIAVLSETLEVATETILGEKRLTVSPRAVSDSVYSAVCMSCANYSQCFSGGETQAALLKLDTAVRSRAAEAEIYKALPFCRSIADVKRAAIEAERRRIYLNRLGESSLNGIRLFSTMSAAAEKILSDASREASMMEERDLAISARLKRLLERSGARFISCSAYTSGRVRITIPNGARISETRLCIAASEAVGTELSPPERRSFGEAVMLEFLPKPKYSVDAAVCRLPAKEGAGTGDAFVNFNSGGWSYLMLSDGMGIGKPAQASSETLLGFMKGLISGGYSVEAAMSLTSAIMQTSTPDESFATADILRVNLQSGQVECFKAGGCRSFVWADGDESELAAGGYPIGILNGVDAEVRRFEVHDRAAVVMMTDGALALKKTDCSRAVESGFIYPSSELAELLISDDYIAKTPPLDDISVSVVKIQKI